jgi:ABC-type Fe3+/spermidine/putrescine transport system ATPase subunit
LAIDAALDCSLSDGAAVRLFTRPEDIEILPAGELSHNQLPALVEQVDYLGDRFEYHVRAAGALFVLPADKKERHAVGAQVRLCFDPQRLNVQSRR